MNERYFMRRLLGRSWVAHSPRLLIFGSVVMLMILAFPVSRGVARYGLSVVEPQRAERENEVGESTPDVLAIDPAVRSTERLLARYSVGEELRSRVAEAIVASSQRHNVDPRLVASIVIVESGANPFVISHQDAVGIMQIHLSTWWEIADRQGVNLLRLEDNVDFGAWILRDYIRQHGLWNGVRRYHGWIDTPESRQEADNYVAKVQRIYGMDPASQLAATD